MQYGVPFRCYPNANRDNQRPEFFSVRPSGFHELQVVHDRVRLEPPEIVPSRLADSRNDKRPVKSIGQACPHPDLLGHPPSVQFASPGRCFFTADRKEFFP